MGIDPNGLWTLTVGVNIGGSLGAIGGGGGTGINLGYSISNGLSFSVTGTYGGGAATGFGGGLGVSVGVTNASSVNQLLGKSVEASRGFGVGTLTGIAGDGYQGGGIAIGLSGKNFVSPQGSGMVTNTSAILQYSNGNVSIGNSGNGSIWSSGSGK